MNRRWSLPPLAAALLALAPGLAPTAAAESEAVRIVVHESNPTVMVTRTEASLLFLKKVTTWGHGPRVAPVDQSDDSSVRAAFSTAVHGKSVSEVKAYWQRMIFSGRSVPPPIEGSDREVIEFVRSHPGAIGYVSGPGADGGVKVLQVVG